MEQNLMKKIEEKLAERAFNDGLAKKRQPVRASWFSISLVAALGCGFLASASWGLGAFVLAYAGALTIVHLLEKR